MPCDVSIGWIYYICSNFFDNVIPIFRVYYFIFCCYFDNCIRWFYYYRLSYIWSNFPIIWIYCVGRCGGLTSSFSWDSNIILTFFATSIFFVFYWRWDCFYVYLILSWNFNDRISWFFRTNWFSYTWGNFPCCWIYFVRCCDCIFTIFTFNSDCFSTFFFCIIFFVNYWRWYYLLLNRCFFPCSVSSYCCWSHLTGL